MDQIESTAVETPSGVAESLPVTEVPSPPETTEAPQEQVTENIDDELGAIFDRNHRERDESGRFVAKNREEPPHELNGQSQEQAKETLDASIPVPASWSAEAQKTWSEIPPAAREFIAKREKEAHDKISQQGQQIAAFAPIGNLIAKHADAFQRNGLSPEDGISRLLAASDALERQPEQAIAALMHAYGVDPRIYIQSTDEAGKEASPQVSALLQKVARLEGMLNETRGAVDNRERHEIALKQKSLVNEIEQFAKSKSDWAELENSVFAEVIAIQSQIDNGILSPMSEVEVLHKAYDRALRNNDAAWKRKVDADAKAAEEKRLAEAKARSADASKAKAVNLRSATANASSKGSMDDTLEELGRHYYR